MVALSRPISFSRVTTVHVNTHAPGSPLVIYGILLLLVLYVAPAGAGGLTRRLITGSSTVAAWAKPRGTTPSDPATGSEQH